MNAGTGAALLAHLADVLTRLRAEGIKATDDPDAVPAPGVWVSPREFDTDDELATWGSTPATVDLWLVAPAGGSHPQAVAQLAALLDQVLAVIDPSGPVQLNQILQLPNAALPAFRFPVQLQL